MYHESVLLHESIDLLAIQPGGIYVDATFGGGGHSRLMLDQLSGSGHLYAFDQDADAAQNALLPEFAGARNFTFIQSNFRHLKRQLRGEGVRPGMVQGILADLGVSSYQLDTAERGFSYRFDAELDMRMNRLDGPTAAEVLNTYSETDLQRVFSDWGEVRNARTLAQATVQARQQSAFRTTGDLTDLCDRYYMGGDRMRYRSQVFQALRMEVNDELSALQDFLQEAQEMLTPGGRLAIITFHSLEDRMVKHFIKTGNVEGEPVTDFYGHIERPWKLITRKPIEPQETEIKANVRARSSRLRVAEKEPVETRA